MAAETLTATRAASTFPVAGHGSHGNLKVATGTYEIAAVVEDGDIFEMCRLPANSVVVGGMLYADDIDTGTEALDMDIGWAANGSESADPDGFGNLGVWTGDVTTDVKPVAGNMWALGRTADGWTATVHRRDRDPDRSKRCFGWRPYGNSFRGGLLLHR